MIKEEIDVKRSKEVVNNRDKGNITPRGSKGDRCASIGKTAHTKEQGFRQGERRGANRKRRKEEGGGRQEERERKEGRRRQGGGRGKRRGPRIMTK